MNELMNKLKDGKNITSPDKYRAMMKRGSMYVFIYDSFGIHFVGNTDFRHSGLFGDTDSLPCHLIHAP